MVIEQISLFILKAIKDYDPKVTYGDKDINKYQTDLAGVYTNIDEKGVKMDEDSPRGNREKLKKINEKKARFDIFEKFVKDLRQKDFDKAKTKLDEWINSIGGVRTQKNETLQQFSGIFKAIKS